MREIHKKDIQKIELDTLIEIDKFCRNHSIEYYLAYGTLIGAIRHNGFIPWDDDIDIMMPRSSYEKFINTFKSTRYGVLHYKNTKNYIYPFAKVCDKQTFLDEKMGIPCESLGVGVDVFPIDGVENNKIREMLKWKKIDFYKLIIGGKLFHMTNVPKLRRTLIRIISALFSEKYATKRIDIISKRVPFNNSSQVCVSVWGDGIKKETQRLEDFCPKEHFFEGFSFIIPSGYDRILKNIFGDYMVLPPEEKRTTTHHSIAYIK